VNGDATSNRVSHQAARKGERISLRTAIVKQGRCTMKVKMIRERRTVQIYRLDSSAGTDLPLVSQVVWSHGVSGEIKRGTRPALAFDFEFAYQPKDIAHRLNTRPIDRSCSVETDHCRKSAQRRIDLPLQECGAGRSACHLRLIAIEHYDRSFCTRKMLRNERARYAGTDDDNIAFDILPEGTRNIACAIPCLPQSRAAPEIKHVLIQD
jgi:hypothetical protein